MVLPAALIVFTASAFQQQAEPAIDPIRVSVGEAAADLLMEAGSADASFMPDGFLKQGLVSKDIGSALQYPTDSISVVRLTGAQIKLALERAVSLYPSPNSAFLYVSGLSAEFKAVSDGSDRILSWDLGGVTPADEDEFRVAMPTRVAKGGLGFFTIWEKEAIIRTIDDMTLESLLKGKTGGEPENRIEADQS